MVIKILGTGCPKCKKLEENTIQAVSQLSGNFTIEKVKDLNDIIDYGVMFTPALVIDEEVKSVGKVLSINEIKELVK